eukprot:gene4269-6048_t
MDRITIKEIIDISLPRTTHYYFAVILGYLLISISYCYSQNIKCEFETIIIQQAINNSINLDLKVTNKPRIIWSLIGDWVARELASDNNQPHYPLNLVMEFSKVQLNLQNGLIFNANACIASFMKSSPQWNQKRQYMRKVPAYIINEQTKFDFNRVIYMWGSIYSKDWQHAVIDFLPLFSMSLPFLIEHKDIPIITGSYIRHFQNLFPFNLFTFIHRDFLYKQQGGMIPDPINIKQLFLIDMIDRQQSYVHKGIYDRILPFLDSKFQYDPIIHNITYLKNQLSRGVDVPVTIIENNSQNNHQLFPSPFSVESNVKQQLNMINSDNNVEHDYDFYSRRYNGSNYDVIYLDRSNLSNDLNYIKAAGKVNGRGVKNQEELLQSIKKVIKSPFRLIVHACKDWLVDRDIMKRAAVIIGPHGGHFTNIIFAPKGVHVIEFGRSSLIATLQRIESLHKQAENMELQKKYDEFRRNKKQQQGIAGMKNDMIGPWGQRFINRPYDNHHKRNNVKYPNRVLQSNNNDVTVSHQRLRSENYRFKRLDHNPRLVFAGMSNSLGHYHWFIEDAIAAEAYLERNHFPRWSDLDMRVNITQVLDTLKAIGVA